MDAKIQTIPLPQNGKGYQSLRKQCDKKDSSNLNTHSGNALKVFFGPEYAPERDMTQIWVAICVYLLAYLKFCNRVEASLLPTIRLQSLNLFAARGAEAIIKTVLPDWVHR